MCLTWWLRPDKVLEEDLPRADEQQGQGCAECRPHGVVVEGGRGVGQTMWECANERTAFGLFASAHFRVQIGVLTHFHFSCALFA